MTTYPSSLAGVRGRTLCPDGEIRDRTTMWDASGTIADHGEGEILEAGDALILPGIVDLHGDAFERQLMPRPGVRFPVAMALAETDRQMVANGITTAYHGVTFSWEPGLRGTETALEILEALDSTGNGLACDTRVHLRMETFNLDGAQLALQWIDRGAVHLLAFNDHFDLIARHVGDPAKMREYVQRSGLSHDELCALIGSLDERRHEVPGLVTALAEAARARGLPLASHDDESPMTRRRYHDLGCALCEFPLDAETAAAGQNLGDSIILGAPNIVRGGSHSARLRAADAASKGLCDVLVSDYYYPSLLCAPFILRDERVTAFGDAWAMVSRNPAAAAGLDDRGEIANGKRADIVVVDGERSSAGVPRVVATFVAGKAAYLGPASGPRP